MKYNIIVSMFVLLFLTACNPSFNTNQKEIKYPYSKKKLKSNKKIFRDYKVIRRTRYIYPLEHIWRTH
ncbi:hypothetical protein HNP68_001122 [Borrelia yangtzensis]|uniref:Lipoprotein n=1 Tax=Borreliella yangtzensis TaxID=683292 RepID=A0ABR6PB47_9SPIR|nr:hypothetical protein [Borreliella yangtzensis]